MNDAEWNKLKKKRLRNPPTEASQNLQSPEVAPRVPEVTPKVDYRSIDARHWRRTNRTVHFATKVTPDFDQTIRQMAHEKGLLITQMLEECLAAYLAQQQKGLSQTKKPTKRSS